MSDRPRIKKYQKLFQFENSDKWRGLASRFGVLPYMVERYVNMLGEGGTISFLSSCQVPPRLSIRCNDLKVDCGELSALLEKKGFSFRKVRWAPHALVLEKSPRKPSLGATPEYLKGYYYIQGLASMLPAYALRPSSSDIVLDMAAAPGGKTTQLAQLMKNSGLIVAIEKRRDRMRSLMSNVNRMGVKNTVLLRAESSIVSKLDLKFSKIILDAPCSGEGLIAKDPSRRTKTTPEHLKRFQGIQINLLTHAIAALDEGGKLIYSTCSIAPEENEAVIDFAIENLGLKTLPLDLGVGNPGLREFRGVSFHSSIENCRRLYPHLHGTEGFFLCLLSR